MPVEIRELIIRTEIQSSAENAAPYPRSGFHDENDTESNHQIIVSEVMENLKRLKDR